MSWIAWLGLVGGMLLVLAVASAYVRRLPITTSALYLGVGVAFGPAGFGILGLDLRGQSAMAEHVTELAVLVALFIGGLKLRVSLRDRIWRPSFWLAGPVMLVSIAAITLTGHLLLGLPGATALLLGAILAPTDPVLASAVAVEDASDADYVRYGLSGEAGLNDGAAAPVIALALALEVHSGLGDWLVKWALVKVLWAVPVALALGYGLGLAVGRMAIHLRSRERDTAGPNDFLALALIALAYVLAELIGTWGFLAVFAAGVGLRAAELGAVLQHPNPSVDNNPEIANEDHPPAEHLVSAHESPEALDHPSVAAGVLVHEVLSFGSTIERLVEIALVVAVGALMIPYWDPRAIPIAFVLFVVARPVATMAMLAFTKTTATQRLLMGWFGVRGIGSLFYVAYALTHGLNKTYASTIVNISISVVALSIIVHGVTAKPVLAWYARRLRRRKP